FLFRGNINTEDTWHGCGWFNFTWKWEKQDRRRAPVRKRESIIGSKGLRDREDLGSVFRGEHSVFEVGGGKVVRRDNRPPIAKRLCAMRPEIDHRFDRQGHPRLDLVARIATTEVRNLRFFMHRNADAMADEVAHHAKTMGFDVGLNRI